MLSLYWVIGIWAVVVSSLVTTAVVTALSIEYTRRVYYFLGFKPLEGAGRAAMREAVGGHAREFWAGGFSHTVMALDSLTVIVLLYGASTDSEALIVLFLSMPTVRAGADWARLLYFDLKRLELRLFTNLRGRFERATRQLAWILGFGFWLVAAIITTIFYGHGVGDLYLALLAFFLARSQLARAQIQAFAEGRYAAVIGTGMFCLAGLVAVALATTNESGRLAGIAVAAALSAVLLGRLNGISREHGEPGTALLTLEWLRALGQVREPVRVGAATLAAASGPERLDARSREDQNRWRLAQLADRAARRLGRCGSAAWVGPDRVVWFERPGDERNITTRWLQGASGGLIADVRTIETPAGEEALHEASRSGLLGRPDAHLAGPIVPVDEADARRSFADTVKRGFVYSPDEPIPPQLAAAARLRAARDPVRRHRLRARPRRRQAPVALRRHAAVRRRRATRDLHRRPARRPPRPRALARARHDAQRARLRGRAEGALSVASLSAEDLRRAPIFAELSKRELGRVARMMSERSYPAGTAVATEGEEGVGFFIVESGDATMSAVGREIGKLGAGDHFGELSLILETPRTVTVVADTELRCYVMTSWDFRKLVETNAAVCWLVLQAVARRLFELQESVSPEAADSPTAGAAS